MTFDIVYQPDSSITDTIYKKLNQYNNELAPYHELESDLAIVQRNNSNAIIAGVTGRIAWGWLYVDCLWVSDEARSQGLGEALLTAIEQEALKHNINKAHLWTTSFQALDFYIAKGYHVFGELEDRPPGHTTYYLKKVSIT